MYTYNQYLSFTAIFYLSVNLYLLFGRYLILTIIIFTRYLIRCRKSPHGEVANADTEKTSCFDYC